MSKNLIYANADEFHVKSTLVYENGGTLYWDSERTKLIYSDELERLFLAGGMKVVKYASNGELKAIFIPDSYSPGIGEVPSGVTVGESGFHSTIRPTEDSLPSSPAEDHA